MDIKITEHLAKEKKEWREIVPREYHDYPEVFEETGCAVCGKLTPICEMEELSEVENLSLLRVDGVTRKVMSKSSDTVKELRVFNRKGDLYMPCTAMAHSPK